MHLRRTKSTPLNQLEKEIEITVNDQNIVLPKGTNNIGYIVFEESTFIYPQKLDSETGQVMRGFGEYKIPTKNLGNFVGELAPYVKKLSPNDIGKKQHEYITL